MSNQYFQSHRNPSKTKTVQEKRQNFRKEVRRQQLNSMFSKIRYQKLNELKTQESVLQFQYQQQRNQFLFKNEPIQKMSMAQYNVFDNNLQNRHIGPNRVLDKDQENIPKSWENGQLGQQNLICQVRDQSQYMSIQQPLPNQSNYNEFQNSQNIPIFVEQYQFPQYSPQNPFLDSFLNLQNQNFHLNHTQNYLLQVQNLCHPLQFQNQILPKHQGFNFQFDVQNQYDQNYQTQIIQAQNIPAFELSFSRNEKNFDVQQNQSSNKRIDVKPQNLKNTKRISNNNIVNEKQQVRQEIQKDANLFSDKKVENTSNSKKNIDSPQYQPKKVCFQPQKMVRKKKNIQSINQLQGKKQLKQHHKEIQRVFPQRQIFELSTLTRKYKVLLRYHSYIVFQKSLGQGSFATVYLGFCTLQQQKVAIKKMPLSKMRNQSEIKCLQQIKHQNIIELKRHFNYQEYCYMVLELCDENLRQRLQRLKTEKISDKQRLVKKIQWVKMLMQGMNMLNEKNVIHRDLKFENVMVKDDVLKICDFGLARQLQSQKLQLQSVRCGTPYTMAPQIFFHPRDSYHKPQYTSKSDTYSLSVIFHQFLYDCHPFDYDTERLKRMKRFNLQRNIKMYNLFLKEYNITQVEWINRLIDGGLQKVQDRMDWKDFMRVYLCGERVKEGFEGKNQQETKKKDVENNCWRQQIMKPKQKNGEHKRLLYSDKEKCFQGKVKAQGKDHKQISVIPKKHHNKQITSENKIPKIRADQLFDQQPNPIISLAQKVFAKPSDQSKNNDIPSSCLRTHSNNLQKVNTPIDPQKHSNSLARTIKQEEPASIIKLIFYLMVLVVVIIGFLCFGNELIETQRNQVNSYKRPLDSTYFGTN